MNIGILGSGEIGATAAHLLVGLGHKVCIANRRGPESLGELVAALGPNAGAGTVDEVADFGDLILVAIPYDAVGDLPRTGFEGKIVIDANNYVPSRDGYVPELEADETTSSEVLAEHLVGSRVVKAFNTIWYRRLATEGNLAKPADERYAIFIAGDDEEAVAAVRELVEALGFGPVLTGDLATGGRLQQTGMPVWNNALTAAEGRALLAAT